jgi:hypothetical protein
MMVASHSFDSVTRAFWGSRGLQTKRLLACGGVTLVGKTLVGITRCGEQGLSGLTLCKTQGSSDSLLVDSQLGTSKSDRL